MDLILLFIPSTAPLESRSLVQGCANSLGLAWAGGTPRTVGRIPSSSRPGRSACSSAPAWIGVLLLAGQIPRILQQQPAGALECDFLPPHQAPHLAPPYLVDRFLQMFDDMEAVEQNLRLGGVFPH